MNFLRTLSGLTLGLALLAQAATAQTRPTTHLPTHRVTRMPGAKPMPQPNAAASSQRGTNSNGNNVYAAPGEPVNVQDNGKNTPSYDGPAPTGAARTRTTLATPK
jgi:hypothetical protein